MIGRRKGGLELLMLEAGGSFGLGGRSRSFSAFSSFRESMSVFSCSRMSYKIDDAHDYCPLFFQALF
jgi:hypothetical protein